MSDILAASFTTIISSLPSRENVLKNSAYPLLRAFAIDLFNLNLVFVSDQSAFLRKLGGNQSRQFFVGEFHDLLNYVSSYQNFVISYQQTYLVITKMVLPFADIFGNQDLAEFVDLGFRLTANILFQESLQPSPGQLVGISA